MKFCPICKSDSLKFDGIKCFYCSACGWEYYQNTAASVAVIIIYNNKVLVVKRNQNPGKGMLDFPGGFVDPMESAEDAAIREIREELNIDLPEIKYFCSAPNLYNYKNIEYSTCDLFFTVTIDSIDFEIDKSEIAEYYWIEKHQLNPDKFVFSSMKEVIKKIKKSLS